MTGLAREVTHPERIEDIPLLRDDDFRIGWETHLAYDHLQKVEFEKLTGIAEKEIKQGNDGWMLLTACKMLQNEIDIGFLDFPHVERYLNVPLNPFGESEERVKRYLEAVVSVYRNGAAHGVFVGMDIMESSGNREYLDMRTDLGSRCDALRRDAVMMEWIAKWYDVTKEYYLERDR